MFRVTARGRLGSPLGPGPEKLGGGEIRPQQGLDGGRARTGQRPAAPVQGRQRRAAAQTPGLAAKRTLACAHVFVRVRVCAHACPVQALHLVSEPSLATWYSRWGCPCRRASGQVRVQWHLAWMSGALGFRTQHTLCWARCHTVIETLPGKQV